MQKFQKGDHVQIADDLGPFMSHFTSGVDAIVVGSYADQYGGNNTKIYTLELNLRGRVSWYNENQLTLIAAARLDLLDEWQRAKEEKIAQESDMGWIFANGESVLKSASGASLQTLGKGLGIVNLWGPAGEGFIYYENAMIILSHAKPFLENGDELGWVEYCRGIAH